MAGPPPPSGGGLWRSVDELGFAQVEALLEAEFPALSGMAAVDRRDMLRLMGASLALAGLAACDGNPRGRPLLSQPTDPETHVPGKPLYFATALELDGYGRGVLVKSHDGRPIKIEGNGLHPASLGATDPFMQAEVLSLYDPDRSRSPWSGGRAREWSALRRWLAGERAAMAAEGGEGTRILIGPTASPTAAGLVARLRAAYPGLRVHSYSPVSDPVLPPPGFSAPVELIHRFDRADVVLSLGADFLGPGPAQVRHARDWAGRRRIGVGAGAPPLLVVAEPSPTLTGAQADSRLPLDHPEIERLARAVASELGVGGAGALPHPRAAEIARMLAAAQGSALVVAGRDQSPAVHALAHAINQRLGAIGSAVTMAQPIRLGPGEQVEGLGPLLFDMAAGRVRRLFVADCNPAYDAPADAAFEAMLARVPSSLHLGVHRDETGRACLWHAPKRHALEAWGDTRAYDGTAALQQPATVPLVPAMSTIELLAFLGNERPDGRALVRRQWQRLGEEEWLRVLEAGVVPGTEAGPAAAAPLPVPPPRAERPIADAVSLSFQPDARVWDGRYANNAWLQELPSPLTKLVWGNAALIAPATAKLLELEAGDLVQIEHGGRAVQAPAWVMPGQARGVVTLSLGYGRPHAGRVGSEIGGNAYQLRTAAAPWATGAVRIVKLGVKGRAISTQAHQPIDDRSAVRSVDIAGPARAAGIEQVDRPSLYPEFPSREHAWGMVIDLDACIGCGTCTIACQAENNIPVVGPEEVERGREMHWIRVDRYHEGLADAPETMFQPLPCMHCEKAPCEVVCPVGATVHSSEGLNQMVYNRCIGTRTCSNNCPYKVRRFNWFDYHGEGPPTPAPVHNPRVTVRDRGVMEKCTYCVQRINAVRAEATVAGREIGGDEVVTACQQACPTNAIVFGDLNDPGSEVSRLKRSGRDYALLGDLNTQPRTSYLARVKRGGPR